MMGHNASNDTDNGAQFLTMTPTKGPNDINDVAQFLPITPMTGRQLRGTVATIHGHSGNN